MPANLENSAVATELERSVYVPIPKKGHAKECSNYCTTALISHASKVCSKFSKPGFNSMWTVNFQMFKLNLEKAEKPKIKLPTSIGSLKKQKSSRKTSISALLTMPNPLTVWINKLENSERDGNTRPPYLPPEKSVCRPRSTVRTRHGTMDWFQIGKGGHQGCILSPCLFNLYAEYIMWNARLDESQAGITTAGRNINNLRYADDTTLTVESE